MRKWVFGFVVVLVLGLVPVGMATHGGPVREGFGDRGSSVIGSFEFGRIAVRPPAEVEGFLVLESRGEPVEINGSVMARYDTTTPTSESPGGRRLLEGGDPLVVVDETMEPFSTRRIPFSVPVDGVGSVLVIWRSSEESRDRMHIDSSQLVAHAPVEVSLDAPEAGARLVSVPGRPAEVTMTFTALPGFNLTDLRLRASEASEEVEIGNLSAGERFTGTLSVIADPGRRFSGLDRSAVLPELHGTIDGEPFSHPLFRSVGDGFEPIHPAVYIASESAAFIIPPRIAELSTETSIQMILLNAGPAPVQAHAQIELSLPGVPRLDHTFLVNERVGAGSVETVQLDWTPPAAGPWQASVHHDLGRGEPQAQQIQVIGPIESIDFQVAESDLARGVQARIPVVLTASQGTEMTGFRFTTVRAPLHGTISIDDLFLLEPVPGESLEPNATSIHQLDLTPLATGRYELFLVVETTEGLSVHNVGTVTVTGPTPGWLLALSPGLAVGVLLGLHTVWRRSWVR